MKPALSIIMSTYNNAAYLEQSLRSILDQTLTNWEFLLINDTSTDNSEDIIFKLFKKDKRLVYIKNSQNHGATVNIKQLVRQANTNLIARLDGDDFWIDKKKLEEQYKILDENKELGMVGTWAKVMDPTGKHLYDLRYSRKDEVIREKILFENPFVTSSTLFRRPSRTDIREISPLNKYADDYNLVLQTGIHKRFLNIPKFYTAYRINPSGMSQSHAKNQIADTIRIVEQYKDFYPNALWAPFVWKLRMFYPGWLKGKTSMNIKNRLKYY